MYVWLKQAARGALFAGLAALLLVNVGCIAATVGLAVKVVGDEINDADAERQGAALVGKGPAAADSLLGPRLETLVDAKDADRMLIIYPTSDVLSKDYRYTVEVANGEITVVSKNMVGRNRLRTSGLAEDLLGKDPKQCEQDEALSEPVLVLRSVEREQLLRVYDSSSLLKGTRFLVLRFDESNRCVEVDAVGLSGSSQDGGIIKGG